MTTLIKTKLGSSTMLKPAKNFFYKDPVSDSLSMVQNYLDKDRGMFFYFRTSCIRMQERFSQLIDHSEMPIVFLHGNPHLENFVKTDKGAAMIDFDRSRYGVYAWDIVRLLASISLRKEKSGAAKKFLPEIVVDYFYEGYLRSFNHADLNYKQPTHLATVRPLEWQKTVNGYLKNGGNWAKKLHDNVISTTHEWVQGVLTSYLESREELWLLEDYFVEKAAQAEGTMQNKRLLILLAPKIKDSGDKILLDIKTVYQDTDTEFYYNTYPHHGIRMIKAAEIYAPHIEDRLGYATYNGEQYWGRAIPSFSYKIKNRLDTTQMLDLAYCVGTQLGQAHRKSIKPEEVAKLNEHLAKNYKNFLKIAQQLSDEIVQAHGFYLETLKKAKTLKDLLKG